MSGIFYILGDRLKFFLGAFWEQNYPRAWCACNDFSNMHTMHKKDWKRVGENMVCDYNRLSDGMVYSGGWMGFKGSEVQIFSPRQIAGLAWLARNNSGELFETFIEIRIEIHEKDHSVFNWLAGFKIRIARLKRFFKSCFMHTRVFLFSDFHETFTIRAEFGCTLLNFNGLKPDRRMEVYIVIARY